MKKLINAPDAVLQDSLRGGGGAWRPAPRELRPALCGPGRRSRSGKGRPGGRRLGHEPMHGGFVGRGMLDAACPGEVFTSPTPDQMQAATEAVDGGAGVVHIVKNYTGDVMNFEMAAELAKGEGTEVESVLTNDDVAVEDSLYTAGRRGGGHRPRREDLRRSGRGRSLPRGGGRAGAACQRERPLDGHGARPASLRARASRASSWARTRSRSASASTGSPGAFARRSVPLRRSRSGS